jgi:hypothetical protein
LPPPFTNAAKAADCPAATEAKLGITDTETLADAEAPPPLGIKDITELPVLLGSFVLMAFNITVCGLVMTLGAV